MKQQTAKRLQSQTTPVAETDLRNEIFDLDCSTPNLPPLDAVLHTPILTELNGATFTLTPHGHYTLRNSRISKIYFEERDWRGGLSLGKFEEVAGKAFERGSEEEREKWEDALAVVDRLQCAEGTVVPSERVGERAKEELRGVVEPVYEGMMFGLDVRRILELGKEIRRQREECEIVDDKENMPLKRKEVEDQPPSQSSKRILLDSQATQPLIRSLTPSRQTNKRPNNKQSEDKPASQPSKRVFLASKPAQSLIRSPTKPLQTNKPPDDNLSQLLASASILTTTQSHYPEISHSFRNASFLDLSTLDSDKENLFVPQSTPPSQENVVLVDRLEDLNVKKALRMARRASSFGGRWHVYHWEVVRCVSGDSPGLKWENDLLWTYVDGEPWSL
jgi:hypothetical protein